MEQCYESHDLVVSQVKSDSQNPCSGCVAECSSKWRSCGDCIKE